MDPDALINLTTLPANEVSDIPFLRLLYRIPLCKEYKILIT